MKLIFLDIDGVMNSITGHPPYEADMETEKLRLLKRIIIETDSKGIVLISDRRFSASYMKEFLAVMGKYDIPVVGQIRNPKSIHEDLNDNRGEQIMDYLVSSKEQIESLVILDDTDDGISSLFEDRYIHVNRYYGLSEAVAQRAKEILERDHFGE